MRNIKKLVAVVLTGVMVMGSAMSALAYTTDYMDGVSNSTLGKTFSSDWEKGYEFVFDYKGNLELAVWTMCGFDSRWLLSDQDYIKDVGGSSKGYAACGYVTNNGSWDYTNWTVSSLNSGTAKVTHKKDFTSYGIKVDCDIN